MLAGGTYRAFEVAGDAMLPIISGTTIVGCHVQDWCTIAAGTPCIVVSQKEGILFRRVVTKGDYLLLTPDNPACDVYELPLNEVLELWEAKAYISAYPMPRDITLSHLADLVQDLQQQVKSLNQ
jgi:hypothetical protein